MSRYCASCMEQIAPNAQICPYCGAETRIEAPMHQLRPGTMLDGRYLVGRALGQGGFGITYIGRDTLLDMRVAIKEYYPNGCSTRNHYVSDTVAITDTSQDGFFQNGKEKFLREAKILARFCDDPGIVGVRDYFESNGTAYIVMEYLDGITLKDYISERGPLPVEGALELMHPVISALAKVHEHGVIHRDISPDNIILLADGRPKLLDFGAAREIAEGKSMSVLLKLGFAPEEQYRRKGAQGPWTDVYALCATLYYCLTGQAPEESIERLWNGDDAFLRPSDAGVDITPAQEAVLLRGLAVKSEERWQSMSELERALYPDPGFQTINGFTLGDLMEEKNQSARPEAPAAAPRRQSAASGQTGARRAAVREQAPQGETVERRPRRASPPPAEREEPRSRRETSGKGTALAAVAIVIASIVLLFSAYMLFRELGGRGAPAPIQTAGPGQSDDNGEASVTFVAAAPSAATPSVQMLKLYLNGQELTQETGFTLRTQQGSVTVTAKAYSNMPMTDPHYSWSTSDSGSLGLSASDDTTSCVCTILRPSGGVTLTVSCYGQVYSIPVYLTNG